MTKEISKEVIAKVFGLYYECQCVYTNIMDNFYSDVNYDVLRRLYTQPSFSPQLILSDLSGISDEDLIEIAKLVGLTSHYCKIRREAGIVYLEEDTYQFAISNNGYCCMRKNGQLYNLNIIEVIDFLRNPNKPSGNAYMLPAFGIPDLFEAGIAVRKNKEV